MYIVVLVTAQDKKEAQRIAGALLKERLAACVNIIDRVSSFFWWDKKIDSAQEVLLVIKAKERSFKQIESLVKALHSYDVPEIIALPIAYGSKEYLSWISESTKENVD